MDLGGFYDQDGLKEFCHICKRKADREHKNQGFHDGDNGGWNTAPLSKSESGDELIFETGTASPFAISR